MWYFLQYSRVKKEVKTGHFLGKRQLFADIKKAAGISPAAFSFIDT
jgi:hypothetical protein